MIVGSSFASDEELIALLLQNFCELIDFVHHCHSACSVLYLEDSCDTWGVYQLILQPWRVCERECQQGRHCQMTLHPNSLALDCQQILEQRNVTDFHITPSSKSELDIAVWKPLRYKGTSLKYLATKASLCEWQLSYRHLLLSYKGDTVLSSYCYTGDTLWLHSFESILCE